MFVWPTEMIFKNIQISFVYGRISLSPFFHHHLFYYSFSNFILFYHCYLFKVWILIWLSFLVLNYLKHWIKQLNLYKYLKHPYLNQFGSFELQYETHIYLYIIVCKIFALPAAQLLYNYYVRVSLLMLKYLICNIKTPYPHPPFPLPQICQPFAIAFLHHTSGCSKFFRRF